MRRVKGSGSLGLGLTAIALVVSPGLAEERMKPVFEHVIPNAEGKGRWPITMPGRYSSTLTCCQAPFATRLTMSP